MCKGIHFANRKHDRHALSHAFQLACAECEIENRLTKVNHSWTNGHVERMKRTLKEATVKRCHDESHDQLHTHLADFAAAYNLTRRRKTLRGLTPYEYVAHS